MVYRSRRQRRRTTISRGVYTPRERPAKSNFQKLTESFSWRLALLFAVVGVVAAVALEMFVSDYDDMGVVVSDGLRLIYETQGDGPPLVTLAGGPGISHHGFHPYFGRMRGYATVIYFDPRGRGDSDEASTYRVADDVRDIESLRRGLSLEKIDLLGVSYGAHLAVAYALERPQRVRKLVLVSPIVGRMAWASHLKALLEAPGMEGVLKQIRREHEQVLLSDPDTAERLIRTLLPLYWCEPDDARFLASTSRSRHRVAKQNFDVYEAIVGRPFGELNGDLAGSEVETRLGEIEAPVLIIKGDCDRVVSEAHVDWLAGQLSHAQKLAFPNAGHSPFIDEPQLFADTVEAFLTSSN
jgi:proline iminopeptidase